MKNPAQLTVSPEELEERIIEAQGRGLTVAVGAAPIPDAPQTIPEAIDQASSFEGEALVGPDGRVAYSELRSEVWRAAEAFRRLGVQRGDRVAVSMSNSVEIALAYFAVQRLGAVWVGVNQALAAREKAYILEHSEARFLLSDEATIASLEDERPRLPFLETVVTAGGAPATEWSELLATCGELDDEWPYPDPHLPAGIAYTSGTTGFPKGAVHSQHNMLLPPIIHRNRGQLRAGSRAAQLLPLTILNIMIVGPVTTLVCAATCVAIDRNSPRGLIDWIKRERLDSFLVAPPTMHDLVMSDEFHREDLEGVVYPGCGGAGVTLELRDAFEAKFGRRFSVGYGMTKAPTSVVFEPQDRPMVEGASGIACPQLIVTIRDDAGRSLDVEERGEFCLEPRGEGDWADVYTPMLGYWKNPAATRDALGEGFYRTGDLGHIDANGYCHIGGRRSEMILRGGANVFPAEIERVILGHEGVRACAVVGRSHERLGEEIVAVIERLSDAEPDIDTIRSSCEAELSRYKVPVEFVVVDSLPRNQMDKVVRKRIQAEILGN